MGNRGMVGMRKAALPHKTEASIISVQSAAYTVKSMLYRAEPYVSNVSWYH